MIKSSNKLIGEIENRDLYNSDDDNIVGGGAGAQVQQDPLNFAGNLDIEQANSTLDLNTRPQGGKKMDFLIKKIQDKKQQSSSSVEHQVVSLGLVHSLSNKLSANELAAKGIKLSIRDSIINFIKKELDQNQQDKPDVQNLLQALEIENKKEIEEKASVDPPKRESVQEFMEKEDALPAKQLTTMLNQHNSKPNKDQDEEESGLLFVDPEAEKRAQLEKEKSMKKKEVPMIKLKDGSMVPSSMVLPAQAAAMQNANNGQAGGGGRRNMLQNLKQQMMQKKSANLTFDKIKETFQKTELDSGKKVTLAPKIEESLSGVQQQQEQQPLD